MANLRNKKTSSLGDFSANVDQRFFLCTVFRMGTARTATFILLLCQAKPRTFISGGKVDLGRVLQTYNRHEFHHMYPQAVLKDQGFLPAEISCLANMCILNSADNNKIRRRRPSEYRGLMPSGKDLTNILDSAIATEVLFTDDYEKFAEQRAQLLADVARGLIE